MSKKRESREEHEMGKGTNCVSTGFRDVVELQDGVGRWERLEADVGVLQFVHEDGDQDRSKSERDHDAVEEEKASDAKRGLTHAFAARGRSSP